MGVVVLALIFMIDTPDPGAGMDSGLKLAFPPAGRPVAFNAIAPLNPSDVAAVIVVVPEDPAATDMDCGDAVIANGS